MNDDTEPPRDNVVVVRKFKNKAEADAVRERRCTEFMYAIIDMFRQQTDVATQVNSGAVEFESFVDAVMGGGTHPVLERWLARRKGTPPADARALRARRLVVLMTEALKRNTGWSMEQARRYAAREVNAANVFPGETITKKAIEHWHERQQEPTPGDEQLLGTSVAVAGPSSPRRIALYFIGLAHYAHNPSVAIVRENNS
jgi:hypothetical protein